jgi:transcriptional regulator with XRE-family HTH domain
VIKTRARRAKEKQLKNNSRREFHVDQPAASGAIRAEEPPRPGPRLKHARLSRGYTMKQLAETAGCSESLISKIEKGRLSPSLSILHKLASALGTSMAQLFLDIDAESVPGVTVMPAGTRPRIEVDPKLENSGSWFERILPLSRTGLLQANILRIPPGTKTEALAMHDGEEFGYVLSGEIEVIVSGVSHPLRKGDVIHFPSSLQHGYSNASNTEAEVLWVNSPPTF